MFNGLPLCGREVGEKIAIPEKIVIFVNQKQSTLILYYETETFTYGSDCGRICVHSLRG